MPMPPGDLPSCCRDSAELVAQVLDHMHVLDRMLLDHVKDLGHRAQGAEGEAGAHGSRVASRESAHSHSAQVTGHTRRHL